MDTTTWTCPNNPFSHDWNGGTTCRSCTATRTAGQAITSLLAGWEGWDTTRAAALVDQYRAEVLAELERPVIEAKRNEIRQSYTELIATAEEAKDFEGAFGVQCRLREREEQWKREDETDQQ